MFILFASACINTFTTTIPKMDYDAPSNEVEYVPSDYDYMYTYESFNSSSMYSHKSFNVDTYSYGSSENYYVMTIASAIPGAIDSISTSIRYLNYKLDILHHYMAEFSSYIQLNY